MDNIETDKLLPSELNTPPTWSVGWAMFALFGSFALSIILGVAMGIFYGLYCVMNNLPIPEKPEEFPPTLLFGLSFVEQVLVLLILMFLIRFVHGHYFMETIWREKHKVVSMTKAAGLGALIMMFNVLIGTWIFPFEGKDIPLMKMVESTEGMAMFAAMAVLIAPISEEVLFRGYIFLPLERKLGKRAAVLITTAIFLSIHALQLGQYWQGLILIGLLGLAAGVLRAYTGGIKASFICHITYNVMLVIAEILGRLA